MFTVLLLIPLVTFFVVGSYALNVIKYVTVDTLRYLNYLCTLSQGLQIVDANLILQDDSQFKRIDVTKETKEQLKKSNTKNVCSVLHEDLTRPHFLSVRFRVRGYEFTKFYPRSKNIVFPPCDIRQAYFPPPIKSFLLLQQLSSDGLERKQVVLDVTSHILPLLGPNGDWFGRRQRQPCIVYIHLEDVIGKFISKEVTNHKSIITLSLKLKTKYNKKVETIKLSRYLPPTEGDYELH